MDKISWEDFSKVELRVGEVVQVDEFPQARKPAFKLVIDFGEEIGKLKSSAQITQLYSKQELIGKQVIAVVNFPEKQIGPLMSQCLVTGVHDAAGGVSLISPDHRVPLGTKLA
ncbi:tRNA-binding protein [Aliikangiella sp. IMCC44653]